VRDAAADLIKQMAQPKPRCRAPRDDASYDLGRLTRAGSRSEELDADLSPRFR
jgi:hypothetical protein